MRRFLRTLLLAVLALSALWFLQHQDTDTHTDPAPTASTTAPPSHAPAPLSPTAADATPTRTTPSSTSDISLAPPVGPVEPEGTPVDPTAAATARDERQAEQFTAYAKAASAFMTDFARPSPSVSDEQWWAKVKAHLTGQAAAAYEGTDPQNVPVTKVTGPATILPSQAPSELLAIARVPTDAGWYQVEMTTIADGIRITRASPQGGRR